jgi:Protein of unknown function (DUF3105)
MSHRRDQKERLRAERERREVEARAAAQRKRLVGVVAAAVLAVVAVVIVIVVAGGGGGGSGGKGVKGSGDLFPGGGSIPKQKVFDLPKAAAAASCQLTSNKATSRSHITDINQKVKYATNPPNSGKHYYIPADDGLYPGKPPKDVQLVHNQEHGRVIIWVKPTLPLEDRKQIRALFDEDRYQMVVVQRKNMPYAVAATAWGREPAQLGTGFTMGCAKWSDSVIDALRAFRDEHRSNGPENVP